MTVFKTVIVESQAKQNYADVLRHNSLSQPPPELRTYPAALLKPWRGATFLLGPEAPTNRDLHINRGDRLGHSDATGASFNRPRYFIIIMKYMELRPHPNVLGLLTNV